MKFFIPHAKDKEQEQHVTKPPENFYLKNWEPNLPAGRFSAYDIIMTGNLITLK